MTRYTPFLKVKANEIAALSALTLDIKTLIIPFLDLPKKKLMSGDSFQRMVNKAAIALARHIKEIPAFYLDNFDIEDDILVNGNDNYQYVIETFRDLRFIPVVGLDRKAGRNELVFNAKRGGLLKSEAIAIRLQAEDFVSFALVEDDIATLIDQGAGLFSRWILVIDNRMCLNLDVAARAAEVTKFISDCRRAFEFDQIIIAGSSIPASIGELVKVKDELLQERNEMGIHSLTCGALGDSNFGFGDYTVVSPLYSDVDIPPAVMLNVMAPRVVYSYECTHFMARGGALRTHPRGNWQYNDIAQYLVGKPFYRGAGYSFGDSFLYEKANSVGSMVTPGSILKPTINAHISYMSRLYGLA